MSDTDPEDRRWSDHAVGSDLPPLPEPWFIRDLREKFAHAPPPVAVPVVPPEEPPAGQQWIIGNTPPSADASDGRSRLWAYLLGAGVLAVVLMFALLMTTPRSGGAGPVVIDSEPATASVTPATAPVVAELADPAPVPPAAAVRPPPAPREVQPREAAGPSFDCSRVTSRVNRAICASDDLSALDRTMSEQFYRIYDAADDGSRADLEDRRRDFLARRQSCESAACIAEVYQDRIAELDDYR